MIRRTVATYLVQRKLRVSLAYNAALAFVAIALASLIAGTVSSTILAVDTPSKADALAEFNTNEKNASLSLAAFGLGVRRVYPNITVSKSEAKNWGLAGKDLRPHSLFLCVSKDNADIQLLGITREPNIVLLHAAESCATRDDAGEVPVVQYEIARQSAKLGIPLLPDYKVDVFPQNFVDVVFSRLGKNLAIGTRGVESDKARIAATALSNELFSFRGAGAQVDAIRWLSSTTSWFHRIILTAFVFAMAGGILIYWTVISDAHTKTRFSLDQVRVRLKFYHEVLHALPTLSLIGTMTGLTITLAEFLGRTSSDPTEAVKANSAALGGIILAFTTTIMAALLLLVGWNLVFVNADARLEAEFEKP